ncbi:MAG: SDR family oxidoreductase [Planctomycetes bacterium]|nr:SDR family oxidoreductase [Planctomycetota bacterium]
MFGRISSHYQDSTAVVIGAGGIGGAIIQQLVGHAARLIVGDRDPAILQGLENSAADTEIQVHPVDVRDAGSVADFFAFVNETAGVPHFLFYTAGILNLESLADTTPEIWDRTVDVNLNGAFYCAQATAQLMIPMRRGSILILGSIAGTRARSGSRVNPVYNTTKAGLSAFVNAAAMQWRPHGIRVNCISPGPTATAMMDLQPAQVHDAISQITLDQRQNVPGEVAELALFIAAHGRFTGEDIGMGGGAGLGG